MFRRLSLALACAASLLSSAAFAGECFPPMLFLLPVVASSGSGEKAPVPFDFKGTATVTLKGTTCENPFTTVANEQVTFTWKLRADAAKDLSFLAVGPKTIAITSGTTMTLPAGSWVFRIERPAPKVGRLTDMTFSLTARYQGEVIP